MEKQKSPKKKLSAADVRLLANSPPEVMEAFNILTGYGVDPVRLCKLIKSRKHPPHRPRKSAEYGLLAFSVREYQEEHPDATDKAAILACVEHSESYKTMSADDQEATLVRLQTALSRYKKRLQKPH